VKASLVKKSTNLMILAITESIDKMLSKSPIGNDFPAIGKALNYFLKLLSIYTNMSVRKI